MGDGDLLRELGQWTLQRLMELEAQALCGAEPHERSEARVNRDAIICALAGVHFVRGESLPPEDEELARKEGWIWVKGR